MPVSQSLLDALIQQESGGDPDVVSKAGARSRMQVMPETARDPGHGVAPARDESLEEFERVGRDYLDAMLVRYEGDTEAALVAYNAGPENADKWLAAGRDYGVLPKREETEPYTRNILADVEGASKVTNGTKPAITDLFAPRGAPVVPLEEELTDPKDGDTGISQLFQERQVREPGLEEKAAAVGKGITTGLVEAGPLVAGAYMGGKIGAAAGALGGPAAPFTVPAGAVIGAGIGGYIGHGAGQEATRALARVEVPWLGETLTFENMEAVPKELRPYAVAGETLGMTAAFATAPYLLVREGFRFAPNLAGRILNSMIEGAAQAPGRFAVAELSMGMGAGLGAGVAESAFPGDPWARMGAEIIGGFANPTRWVMAAYSLTARNVRKLASTFSSAAQRNSAQDFIIDLVAKYGEDPEALAVALRDVDIEGVALTAGQKTESPALLALEQRLIGESAQFGEDSRKMAENSLIALRNMIKLLESAGDPESLRIAAQARSDYLTTLLTGRLAAAEEKALAAAADIDTSLPGAVSLYGRQTGGLLQDMMKEVRKTERELWSQVNLKAEAGTDNIIGQYDAIKAEMLPGEKLPPIIEAFVRLTRPKDAAEKEEAIVELARLFGEEVPKLKAEFEDITIGLVQRFRSRTLELAREAAADNKWGNARFYGQLAESALDDLDAAGVAEPAYDLARQYSRILNDTFTRTFAGQAMKRQPSGAGRIPPELIMQRAFSTSGEIAELQFRQLEVAATLAGQEHLTRMMALQENMIRAAAARTVNTMTGRVNPQQLAKFRAENAELLQRFPTVAKQLETAEGAEVLLREAIQGHKATERTIRNQGALTRLMDGENPEIVVRRALTSGTPEKEYTRLARLAKQDPGTAEALASATLNHAYNKASIGKRFSFQAYREVFASPLSAGKGNLRGLMIKEGIVTRKGMDLLDEFLERAVAIEHALEKRAPIEQIPDKGAAIFDFMARLAGARFAAIAPTGGAHGLIVGGAGSRLARQVLDKIPTGKIRQFIIAASRDPEIMAAMLESPKSAAAKRRIALQMNAFLWQSGIMQAYEDEPVDSDFFVGP